MKAIAVVGREPAVKASPAHPEVRSDGMGRRTTVWTKDVPGRPEGPPAVCVATVGEHPGRAWLSKDEAYQLASDIVAAADTL